MHFSNSEYFFSWTRGDRCSLKCHTKHSRQVLVNNRNFKWIIRILLPQSNKLCRQKKEKRFSSKNFVCIIFFSAVILSLSFTNCSFFFYIFSNLKNLGNTQRINRRRRLDDLSYKYKRKFALSSLFFNLISGLCRALIGSE